LGTVYQNIHRDLIEQCKKGDSKAQFEVYKLYYKAMYNTCYRIVNHSAEAEDIMQEAFLAAFGKLDTYKGEVSFGAWLKKIVINRSLDSLKKKKATYDSIDDLDSDLPEDENLAYNFETDQLIDQIKLAIQQLDNGYRVVLTLYLLEDYDHEEIGRMLGISPNTSRSQLSRAKKRLLEILNQSS
jgi:RNA polymerase sigma-70 factor (ECF subfamily)